MQRSIVALSSILVMHGIGAIYSYNSVFVGPLQAAFGRSAFETILPFMLVNFFLGIGGLLGGIWQDRVGPRNVAVVGSALWAIGNAASGLGLQFSLPWLAFWYGVVGGIGCGLAYISVVSAMLKWFPKHSGFAGGFAVMPFGFGAVAYGIGLRQLPASQQLSTLMAAVTPGQLLAANYVGSIVSDLAGILLASGLVFAVVGIAGALLLSDPPKERLKDQPEVTRVSVMLTQSPEFYLLWFMLLINVVGGLIVISNVVPILQELTGAPLPLVVTLYSVLAAANGLGRIGLGVLSDRIGRRLTFNIIFGAQGAAYLMLATGLVNNLWFGALIVTIVLACYGGGFGTMPGFAADIFGVRRFGTTYGLILTAWGVAGLIGPSVAVGIKSMGLGASVSLTPISILMIMGLLFPLVIESKRRSDAASARLPASPSAAS